MSYIITGTVFNKPFQKKKKRQDEEPVDDNFSMDNYNSGMVFGTASELIAMRVNKVEDRKYEKSCDCLENERLEFKRVYARKKYQMEKQYDRLSEIGENSYTYLEPLHYQRLEYLYNIGKLKMIENPGDKKGPPRPQSSKLIAEKARSLRMSPMYKRPTAGRARTANTKLRKDSRASVLRIHPIDNLNNQGDDYTDNNTLVLQSNRSMALRITKVDGYQKSTPLHLEHHIPHALLVQNSNLDISFNNCAVSYPRQSSAKSFTTSPFVTNVKNYKHQYNLHIPPHVRKNSTTSTDLLADKASKISNSATSFNTLELPPDSTKKQHPLSAQQRLSGGYNHKSTMTRPATSMEAKEIIQKRKIDSRVNSFLKSFSEL